MEEIKTDTPKPVIVINNLYKSFDDFKVLTGVDLTLNAGENLAVLGRSGSGKSVLIKLIVGLLKPDQGEILVFNQNVVELDIKALNLLRLKIGFSFQNSALYDSMNVYENLAFPLKMNTPKINKSKIDAAVEEALEAVGLAEKSKQMPTDLSGGQRKRIGIARTLIMKPEIMLYDEPTAGLDPITCQEINNLIQNVNKQYNTSSIIITHDLTCAKETASRVALLVNGKFTKTGTFDEVFLLGESESESFYKYNFIQ